MVLSISIDSHSMIANIALLNISHHNFVLLSYLYLIHCPLLSFKLLGKELSCQYITKLTHLHLFHCPLLFPVEGLSCQYIAKLLSYIYNQSAIRKILKSPLCSCYEAGVAFFSSFFLFCLLTVKARMHINYSAILVLCSVLV